MDLEERGGGTRAGRRGYCGWDILYKVRISKMYLN